MDKSLRILYQLDGEYPYINQTLINKPGLYVTMNTDIYNSFCAKGKAEIVYRWVLDKQVELFREGLEVAVFRRLDLDNGQVKVVFAAKFPSED